jgi:hypothetical protein
MEPFLLTFELCFAVVPIVTLKLGASLDPDNIRENGDVYLEVRMYIVVKTNLIDL